MKKFSFLLIATLLMSGCALFVSTPPPSPTATVSSPTVSPTPGLTATGSLSMNAAKIALVDVSPAEPGPDAFGCGDNIVMVSPANPITDLQGALESLLAIKQREYQYGDRPLMDVLADAHVIVNAATIADGKANIEFEGYFTFAGTCDVPRLKEQIKRTIMQFPEVKSYTILLNGSTKEWDCVGDQSGKC